MAQALGIFKVRYTINREDKRCRLLQRALSWETFRTYARRLNLSFLVTNHSMHEGLLRQMSDL